MRSSPSLPVAAVLAFWALCLPLRLVSQEPEWIFHNGKVLTLDSSFSIAQAVAIAGNRIRAVGSNEQVLALAGQRTQAIDLKGRTVIPGLVDTHRHVFSAAEQDYGGLVTAQQLNRYPVDWRAVKSVDDVLAQISGILEKTKLEPGRWLYLENQVTFTNDPGSPLNSASILLDALDQWKLDKVAPANPILMTIGITDFNGCLLNRKAMDWLMANHGEFVKKNGRYWVNAAGQPDGHLEPPASRLALPFVYDRDPAVLASLYLREMEETAAMGLTAVSTRMPQDSLAAFRLLEAREQLRFRIGYGPMEPFGTFDVAKAGLKQFRKQIGSGSEKIWLTGVGPSAVDGGRSRQCTDQKRVGTYTPIDGWFPFGQCHTDAEYKGAVNRAGPIQENYFQDWIMASGRDGVRLANTHVAGDRATAQMLSLVEELQRRYGKEATKNWAFDHCGMVNPRDIPKLAKLKITMSCYVRISVNDAAALARAYGEQVANTFPSPLGSMLKAGVKVVLESNSDSYLWEDLQAAVTRRDRQGRVWGEQDRVDRPTALRMLTSWAADYLLRGDQFGSIEAGKLADLVVLDSDYLTIPEDKIGKIQPQLTLFDGRIVFLHPQFAAEYGLKPEGAVISTYRDLVKNRVRRISVDLGG